MTPFLLIWGKYLVSWEPNKHIQTLSLVGFSFYISHFLPILAILIIWFLGIGNVRNEIERNLKLTLTLGYFSGTMTFPQIQDLGGWQDLLLAPLIHLEALEGPTVSQCFPFYLPFHFFPWEVKTWIFCVWPWRFAEDSSVYMEAMRKPHQAKNPKQTQGILSCSRAKASGVSAHDYLWPIWWASGSRGMPGSQR